MTSTREAATARESAQFITHSPGAEHSPRSGGQKMNAPSTKPSSTTSRRGPDSSDRAQAQIFAAMLTVEINAVSALVDEAEQLAHNAGRIGQGTARLWHNEEARSQRKLLYALHRQLDALHTRFTDVSG